MNKFLETLERREIAGASWRDNGAIILVPDLATAAQLSNRVARSIWSFAWRMRML